MYTVERYGELNLFGDSVHSYFNFFYLLMLIMASTE